VKALKKNSPGRIERRGFLQPLYVVGIDFVDVPAGSEIKIFH
jgi:hypothetical protein